MKKVTLIFGILFAVSCRSPAAGQVCHPDFPLSCPPVVEPACNPAFPWSCPHGQFCEMHQDGPLCRDWRCGDQQVEPPEECDTPDSISCASVIGGEGYFECGKDCRWDYSGCRFCGNGFLNGLEECDKNRFAEGFSCVELGFSGGEVRCLPTCRVDTSLCLP
jgi:hypothetical protein